MTCRRQGHQQAKESLYVGRGSSQDVPDCRDAELYFGTEDYAVAGTLQGYLEIAERVAEATLYRRPGKS